MSDSDSMMRPSGGNPLDAMVNQAPHRTARPSMGAGPGSVALRAAALASLVLLVFVAFYPAMQADFVNWDDYDLLIEQTRYRTLTADNLRWMFSTSIAGHFQPLTWLSYTLDYRIWGLDPFGYHLTNIILHGLTAVLVYLVACRLFNPTSHVASSPSGRRELSTAMQESDGRHGGRPLRRPFGPELSAWVRNRPAGGLIVAAWFAAVLFAVHPLRAESVAWVSERRDVLSGALYVLSVWLYLRFALRDRGVGAGYGVDDAPGRGWTLYGCSVAACALSLLAKATAITLPFVLVVLDAYPLRRLRAVGRLGQGDPKSVCAKADALPSRDREGAVKEVKTGPLPYGRGSERTSHTRSKKVWVEKIPFFALALLGAVSALHAQREGGGMHALADHDWAARVAQALHGLTFYLEKTIWPTSLGPIYEIPPRDVLLGRMFWGSLLIVIGVTSIVVMQRKVWPGLAAALGAYALVVAPVLGFAQSGPQLVADRYSYISCIGLAMVAGELLRRCLVARPSRRPTLGPFTAASAGTAVMAALTLLTFRQVEIWRSPMTLWARGVEVSQDSAIAHVCYADALAVAQDVDSAKTHYERGLEINPNDPVAWHHLADLHAAVGDHEEAVRHYHQALKLDPNRSRACLALSRLLVESGMAEPAVQFLRDGAQRNPNAVDLLEYLANLLATHPEARIRNGPEAVEWAQRVFLIRGRNDVNALMTLGSALAETGRFDEAIQVTQRAQALAERLKNGSKIFQDINQRLALYLAGEPFRMRERSRITDDEKPGSSAQGVR